jgi:glycosyltransferase involved in cell wall biosynthesis
MLEKADALIFAPLPPPVGGVASIVAMLHQSLGNKDNVVFASPIEKGSDFLAVVTRPLHNGIKLIKAAGRIKKGGRILFFSSASSSFFEKNLWVLLVILRGRKPSVVMVDGNFPRFWDKCPLILKKVSKFILSNKNVELGAQSEYWRQFYRAKFPLCRIKVIGATVAKEFFDYTQLPSSSTKNVTILYVGWIIQDKGIVDLLDAMAILRNAHPEVRLRLVGPLFGKESYWNGVAADRNISTQVKFLGSLSNRQSLINEFNKASIFVFPSHFEGFPVALLEAITMGLACVGTSVGGVPDILNHGKAGIVVSPNAPIELANAMKVLLEDNDLVEDLSKQASIRARSVYNIHECVESYKKLLGLRGVK